MQFLPKMPSGWDFWLSLPVIAALAALAGLLALSSARISRRAIEIRHERQALAEEVRRLGEEKARLESELSALESQEAVERMAKERLGLRRPGEEVVVVVPERTATPSPPSSPGIAGAAFLPGWLRELVSFLLR